MIGLIVLLSFVVGPCFIQDTAPKTSISVPTLAAIETPLAFFDRSLPCAVDVPRPVFPDRQVFRKVDMPHPITKLLQIEQAFIGDSPDSNLSILKFLASYKNVSLPFSYPHPTPCTY